MKTLSTPSGGVSTAGRQLALCLPARPTDEILREQLELAVEQFNDPLGAPESRIALYAEIQRLRALLGKVRK